MNLNERYNSQYLEPTTLPPDPATCFIEGGIKAARHSSSSVRAQILHDLSEILSCEPDDLEFLFSKNDHKNFAFFDFPDSRRRRKIIRANKLMAAE